MQREERESGVREDASAQEVEVGAAVHGAFEELEAIDVSFEEAVGVVRRAGLGDGLEVERETTSKRMEGTERRSESTCNPGGEELRMLVEQEILKVRDETQEIREERIVGEEVLNIAQLTRGKGVRGAKQEKGSLM